MHVNGGLQPAKLFLFDSRVLFACENRLEFMSSCCLQHFLILKYNREKAVTVPDNLAYSLPPVTGCRR